MRSSTRLTPPHAHPDTGPARNNLRGAVWLLTDMSLNIWSLAIVKSLGVELPSIQIVFIRALIGLIIMVPFVLRAGGFPRLDQPGLQVLRIGLSTAALTSSFYAIAHLPLAMVTAVNFTRPLLMMGLAALLLSERIRPVQWLAGGIGLVGVLVAVQPGSVAANAGLAALFVAVLTGTGAVIILRRLRHELPLAMMVYQTGGLAAAAALPAIWVWQPPGDHWPTLLLIGVFSQAAQFCFMRAHYWGDAGVLAPLSYASLILSVAVGFFVFGEVPTVALGIGATLIIGAALLAATRR